jgi:ubiquitin C-terminal hydrolase
MTNSDLVVDTTTEVVEDQENVIVPPVRSSSGSSDEHRESWPVTRPKRGQFGILMNNTKQESLSPGSSSSVAVDIAASPTTVVHDSGSEDGIVVSPPTDQAPPTPRPWRVTKRNNVTRPLVRKKAVKLSGPSETLQRLIQEAEYEVNHDPYRGMRRYVSSDEHPPPHSPWELCAVATVQRLAALDEYEFDQTHLQLQQVTGSQCPTLLQWTEQQESLHFHQLKKKKGKVASDWQGIGRRVVDVDHPPSCRCACDYNPFCLVTLGGAMNQVLVDRLPAADRIEAANDDHSLSAATQRQVQTLRASAPVPISSIRTYLHGTLQDISVLPVRECLARLKQRHESLRFDQAHAAVDEICLSIPPGMQNLGATCYLNTQLQCLARNLVFVQGILSWRAPAVAGSDRMIGILHTFQRLMADLVAGPQASVSTLDFSDALGLNHFEQQDPNEFSRLFFDKMQESFQKSSASSNGRTRAAESQDIAELLPNLFRGTLVYKTTCLHCRMSSERSETFMDVNLPIVHPERTTSRNSQKEATTLQYCLDQYSQAETLQGDNQYYCDECGCKRNADRALSFQRLPHVLNVQLCRYVYDRAKFQKKKLTDQVLLSRELRIPDQDSTMRRYLLAAVMRHKGTSAYSGHYIAEAMDWVTGQWYEFNDDQVTWLPSGPSHSVEPTTTPPTAARKSVLEQLSDAAWSCVTVAKGPAGSDEAYNMYYVEENFLAQAILDHLRAPSPFSMVPWSVDEGILQQVNRNRTTLYGEMEQ